MLTTDRFRQGNYRRFRKVSKILAQNLRHTKILLDKGVWIGYPVSGKICVFSTFLSCIIVPVVPGR